MRNSGFQFFVAASNGVRLPVREDKVKAIKDAEALGTGAKVIPLLTKQAMPLIAADLRQGVAA